MQILEIALSKNDKFAEDYEDLQKEIIKDKIQKVFEEDPITYREALEDIGFTWFDDEYPSEEEEENAAVPHNETQKTLVAYFGGHADPSDYILNTFQSERHSDPPNYPLIRKYFRSGNERLKSLLLYGLKKDPTSIEFLSDLALFNEFRDILPDLIEHFIAACQLEGDLPRFSDLVQEFFYSVGQDEYDVLLALRTLFDNDRDKKKIIEFLADELPNRINEEISF